MKAFKLLTLVAVAAVLGAVAYIYFGVFPPGADEPHSTLVYKILQTSRNRSIAVRANDISVPDLSEASAIKQGAGNYAAMCSGCHLAPGMPATELSRGLYPVPPALASRKDLDPAEAFWVIKHGVKMSAMPAWGKSMNDSYIWGLVAFLKKMPTLSPDEYRDLVASSGGHSHGGGESMGRDEVDMPAHDHEHTKDEGHDAAAPHHHDTESSGDHDDSERDAGGNRQESSGSPRSAKPETTGHVHATETAASPIAGTDHSMMTMPAGQSMAGMDHSKMHGMAAAPSVAPVELQAKNPPEEIVKAFQDALQVGNRKLALQFLSPSVQVIEGGETQSSRDEYAAHHLQSDIEFLKASRVVPLTLTSTIEGTRAVVRSTARIFGSSGGKPIDVVNSETATLEKTSGGWRIVAISWTSSAIK